MNQHSHDHHIAAVDHVVISHVAIDEITLATGERLHDQLGGAGSHAAAGMALVAGPGRVGILSGVGADLPDSAKDWFATAGVDTAGLYITDPHTPRTVVVYAADGERVETPLYGPEHFAAASPSQVPVPASYVRPAAIYLFAGLEDDLWQRAVDLADPSGRRPASLLWELDAAVCRRERLDGLAAHAAQVDVLSLNRAEARSLCDDRHLGRCLDTLHDKGFEVVALRLGAGGAIVSTPEGVWGALPETGAVVDPTGAGNAFGGALAASWAQQRDPGQALRAAMAAAALSIGQHGPIPVDPLSRRAFDRLVHRQVVTPVIGRHREVDAEGRLHEFGDRVPPVNAEILRRYPHREHIPLRGFLVDGRPALTRIDPQLIGEYVLLTVRDPLCDYDEDPAEQIGSLLDDVRVAGRSGMFTTCSGTYRGARISVVSGGSGGPEAELALQELLEYTDATTFLRVGGSGGMHESVRPGDVVIASGVVRDEGLTTSYIPAGYPAACAPEVVLALATAASRLGVRHHIGTTRSADSDYVGGGRPSVGGYLQPWHLDLADTWRRAGVLNGDRESAAVVTLARLFGRRGGAVCSVADNLVTGEPFLSGAGHDSAIRVALDGMAVLHRMDRARERAGVPIWLPELGLAEVGE